MSSRRERTRLAILDAAWKRLSVPNDPAHLEDIAADAGVSRQSVYLHFGTRGALLVALVQHIDEQLGLLEQLAEVKACEDPVLALEKVLRVAARYQPKIHGVAMALATFSATDAEARTAFEDRMRLRREGFVEIVRGVKRRGRLMRGWSVEHVADVLWEVRAPSSYHHLVVERGWSVDAFERWLVHTGRSFLVDAEPE